MLIVSVGGEIISAEENMRLLARLRFKMPDVPLVIIADYESSDETAAALRAGAQGYIQNGIGPELATRALSLLLRGGSYFPLAALRELLRRAPRENDGPDGHSGSNGNSGPGHSLLTMGERLDEMSSLDDLPLLQLTTRQREVVYFLRQGNSNKLIARRLGMAETTVKVHVRQIMRKLGASNRTQAAILLREMQRVAA
jgi:DNA-binding NarL/FixJ family response regulator